MSLEFQFESEARSEAIAAKSSEPDPTLLAYRDSLLEGVLTVTELKASLPPANSEEAKQLLAKTKPEYYGKLSLVIDYLVEDLFDKDKQEPRVKPIWASSSFIQLDSTTYDNLKYRILGLHDCDPNLHETIEYLRFLSAFRSLLATHNHSDVFHSLMGGGNTASQTTIALIRSLPLIVEDHTGIQLDTNDLLSLAKRSKRLVFKACSFNGPQHFKAWTEITRLAVNDYERPIDPNFFVVNVGENGNVTNVDFAQPLDSDVISELEGDPIGPTIGCPIVLSPQTLSYIWNSVAEISAANGLWRYNVAR